MSLWDYQRAREVTALPGVSFDAAMMAAAMMADSENAARLRMAFPSLHREVTARWNAPGGRLENDPAPHG